MNKSLNYTAVKNSIPEKIQQNAILNITTKDISSHTHGFHKYPAKFIPHIPRWAIQKYLRCQEPKTVLDPFCGSGTTLVEGVLAGHNVIGVDIDPLSAMISKVKTTRLRISKLKEICEWLVGEIQSGKHGTFKPECETLDHWFTKDAIRKLSLIRTVINQVTQEFGDTKSTRDIQDFLYICFSSIIRRVSNADNETQKTYVSHTKIKEPEEVNSLFLSQLEFFIKRISEFKESVSPKIKCEIIVGSSSDGALEENLKDHEIGLVITSPPYIKSIDYIYNQMAELFWIGDLFDMQTQTHQNRKKNEYIGNKQIPKIEFNDYDPYSIHLGIKKLDRKLKQVFDTDLKNGHKHSYITFKYFEAMEKHFQEIAKCLYTRTHYIMVVGDSSVSGIYFDTAEFLVSVAERNGFRATNKWGYKIKNRYMRFDRKGRGGRIEIDWVLDFEKK